MKKIIFLILPIFAFSQTSQEYFNELTELRREYQSEVNNAKSNNPLANISEIQAKYSQLENELSSKYLKLESRQKNLQNNKNVKSQNLGYENYDQTILQNYKNQQIESQNNYQQELSSTLNSLSSSLQAMAYNQIKSELNRRYNTANTFAQFHQENINKLQEFYNQIPKSEFKNIVNGIYTAYLIEKKKYSFVNNQELVTQTPVLVNVENDIVKNIYLYGKEKMEILFPKNYPEKSKLSNGFVVYNDYETLNSTTLLVLEPYTNKNPTNYVPSKNDVSYITVWTSNKKDEGKIIYIQELDKKGNIIREISTPILYSKNKKEINDDYKKIPINPNCKLLFFGEVTKTPYGNFPLYPRMSKSDMNELKDGEYRTVEIKKYRE